jgi:hypothetical protein
VDLLSHKSLCVHETGSTPMTATPSLKILIKSPALILHPLSYGSFPQPLLKSTP